MFGMSLNSSVASPFKSKIWNSWCYHSFNNIDIFGLSSSKTEGFHDYIHYYKNYCKILFFLTSVLYDLSSLLYVWFTGGKSFALCSSLDFPIWKVQIAFLQIQSIHVQVVIYLLFTRKVFSIFTERQKQFIYSMGYIYSNLYKVFSRLWREYFII